MKTRAISLWLYGTCALILVMIALGGVTRLEGAGLSMVDWRPITGWLPPLSEDTWEQTFAQYKLSPEFKHINFMFTLSDFKTIFWLEYWHRILGRLIGLWFFLPGLWFWMRGHFTPTFKKHFMGMLLLLGMQGLMGWYMVKSGLVDQPHVSPYRLAAHLFLALILYSWILWTALSLKSKPHAHHPRLASACLWMLVPLVLTIFYGALVAGLKAGLVYNTFPLMEGAFLASDAWAIAPWYRNLLENPSTVQFIHRWLACGTALGILGLTQRYIEQKANIGIKIPLRFVQLSVLLQVTLGIFTLLYGVPTSLATLHQLGAVGVLTAVIFLLRRVYSH